MQSISNQQSGVATNHPNVIAKPPTIFLSAIGLAYLANYFAPIYFGSFAYHQLIGAVLIFSGLTFVSMAMQLFKAKQTPIEVWQQSQALVTTGVYKYSRNPIYLGMYAIYAGILLVGLNGWLIVLLGPLVGIMTFGVVLREETYLHERFGKAYEDYMTSTRRWI